MIPAELLHFFSAASDGDLGRDENPAAAARFARGLGLAGPSEVFVCAQLHGNRIFQAAGEAATPAGWTLCGEGDGVFAEAGRIAAVFTADCVPVLLADPVTRTAAAIHAGWRGAAEGILEAALARFAAAGGSENPPRLLAWVGPAARGCCYEVERDVAVRVRARLGAPPPDSGTKVLLDMAGLVAGWLRGRVASVHLEGSCTICDSRFHSHRRATREGRAAGRMISGIGWRTA